MQTEDLKKNFFVQIIQTMVAISIVFMVRTVSSGRLLSLAGYCTSDVILAFCSGYLSLFFCRWSECWWDNVIISVLGLLFSSILYGLSFYANNNMVTIFVCILAGYYFIGMLLEYCICPMLKLRKNSIVVNEEELGYKDIED